MQDTTSAIATTLDQVRPRLKQARRGLALTALSEATGISKSTLSRLETGQCRGGLQAWKIIVSASNSTPAPKAHEGYEWLFVLSSAGDEPAEILSMFGPQGERVHARAKTTCRKAPVE